MQLMLVEGEDDQGGGHSCGMLQDLRWKLHADALTGLLYATDKSNSNPDRHLWEVEVRAFW